MTAAKVRKIIDHKPFKPFRIVVLLDGEEIIVRRRRKAHVSGPGVALVGECRRRGGPVVERFRMFDVSKVATVENVDLPIIERY